jgi:hypothetical protein
LHAETRETFFGKFLENCHTFLARWSIGIKSEEVYTRKKVRGYEKRLNAFVGVAVENIYSRYGTTCHRDTKNAEKDDTKYLSPAIPGRYGDNNLPTQPHHGRVL